MYPIISCLIFVIALEHVKIEECIIHLIYNILVISGRLRTCQISIKLLAQTSIHVAIIEHIILPIITIMIEMRLAPCCNFIMKLAELVMGLATYEWSMDCGNVRVNTLEESQFIRSCACSGGTYLVGTQTRLICFTIPTICLQ